MRFPTRTLAAGLGALVLALPGCLTLDTGKADKPSSLATIEVRGQTVDITVIEEYFVLIRCFCGKPWVFSSDFPGAEAFAADYKTFLNALDAKPVLTTTVEPDSLKTVTAADGTPLASAVVAYSYSVAYKGATFEYGGRQSVTLDGNGALSATRTLSGPGLFAPAKEDGRFVLTGVTRTKGGKSAPGLTVRITPVADGPVFHAVSIAESRPAAAATMRGQPAVPGSPEALRRVKEELAAALNADRIPLSPHFIGPRSRLEVQQAMALHDPRNVSHRNAVVRNWVVEPRDDGNIRVEGDVVERLTLRDGTELRRTYPLRLTVCPGSDGRLLLCEDLAALPAFGLSNSDGTMSLGPGFVNNAANADIQVVHGALAGAAPGGGGGPPAPPPPPPVMTITVTAASVNCAGGTMQVSFNAANTGNVAINQAVTLDVFALVNGAPGIRTAAPVVTLAPLAGGVVLAGPYGGVPALNSGDTILVNGFAPGSPASAGFTVTNGGGFPLFFNCP